MASVSNVDAQQSFNAVKTTFETNGLDALTQLSQAATAAIAAVAAQAEFITADFAEANTEITSVLIGTDGGNLLHERVKADLETEDYGINPAEEEALFERMRERESRTAAVAVDGALRLFSSGGFSTPTGAAASTLAALQAATQDRIVSANREMTVKQADLYRAGKKDALDHALAVEKLQSDIVFQTIKRALDVLGVKLEEFKQNIQSQAALATAAMSGMNVNLGLSISGSANVGGNESVSESEDKSASAMRNSTSHSYNENTNPDAIDTFYYHNISSQE